MDCANDAARSRLADQICTKRSKTTCNIQYFGGGQTRREIETMACDNGNVDVQVPGRPQREEWTSQFTIVEQGILVSVKELGRRIVVLARLCNTRGPQNIKHTLCTCG